MKKQQVQLLLIIVVFFAFSACDKADNKKTMAIIIPSADHGFLGESIAHAEAAEENFAAQTDYKFELFISDNISGQILHIEQAIKSKVDVVVLWPHNGDDLKEAAQKVLDAGIPLIIYDRLISDFDETAELLGDNPTIGKETGNYFNAYFASELAKGRVKILEFMGDASSVSIQRSEGFWSTADPYFLLVEAWHTKWSTSTAQQQMEYFLTNNSQDVVESIRAVFTHDAEVAAGVLAAIEAYNGSYSLNIRLVSAVSASRELLQMFDHYQALGIDQVTFSFSPAMIVDAIELGIDILDGKNVSGTYLIPTEMVDNSNYEAFMEGSVYRYRYFMEGSD